MRALERILAISDPHGENRKLLELLKKAEYEPRKDLLVIAGDMVDWGEENLDCLRTCIRLRSKGAILLKGNHEHWVQKNIEEMLGSEAWRSNPSERFYKWSHNSGAAMYHEIKGLPPEKLETIVNFMRTLPLYYSIDNYIFSHAGANVKKPICENTEDELEVMSKSFLRCPAYPGKMMVFGHLPTWNLHPKNSEFRLEDAKIWYDRTNQDKIGIDCGSCFGGRLAALELPSCREFYV